MKDWGLSQPAPTTLTSLKPPVLRGQSEVYDTERAARFESPAVAPKVVDLGASPVSVTPGAMPARTTEFPSRAVGLVNIPEPPNGGTKLDPVKIAPPWLISMVFHMLTLIILALVLLPSVISDRFELKLDFAEELGEQLDNDVALLSFELDQQEQQIITPDDLPPVEAPLFAPPEMPDTLDGLQASSELTTPAIGLALTGREQGMKEVLLGAYGGNAITEKAVIDGLEWLKRNQLRNGAWSLTGPYKDGAHNKNSTAATAMALLAFQGAGYTHQKRSRFQEVVSKGVDALLKMQTRDGDFWRGRAGHHRLYSQAQASIAICELYGMTKDSRLRDPAQRSINYAVKTQDSLGGWRYFPGSDSDTSVTGWFVMALQSGRMAGLDVPSPTLSRVSKFLDRVTRDGSRYGYQPGMDGTYSMTAEALLCRQYLGWKHDDPRLVDGVKMITTRPIRWNDRDVYYWYYATQVLHHMEGDEWEKWNNAMKKVLPANQTKRGPERGSWSPGGDRWGAHGGRLYVTCLSIYLLEVYYRHMPLYAGVAD